MRESFLPFALPDIGEAEHRLVREVLDSGWLTTGSKVRQFEEEFATRVGAHYAVAVNSCTAAMHLALEAIELQPGDMVATTPYTFAATAEVIRYFDAIPVFVDVEPKTLNIDPNKLTDLLKTLPAGQVKAVIPVHIAGYPCDLTAIYRVAERFGLQVIEDAAHAFPTLYDGQPIGRSRDDGLQTAVCFSFYATKTLTTGEGGMICTPDEKLAERFRMMALHGISKDAWKRYTAQGSWYYEILTPGYKYNMPDLAAALGLAQLQKADLMHQRRMEIAQQYDDAFRDMPEVQMPFNDIGHGHAWHLYMLRLNRERLRIERGQFIDELKQRNIGTSVHFIPLHVHPYYREKYNFHPEDFPVALAEFEREISLPIYSKMSDADSLSVIEAVVDIVDRFRK